MKEAVGSPVRKKLQEFDGNVFWEAYCPQFELLAAHNGWDDQECAVQLATSLRGVALEVFAQLDSAARSSYNRLAQALEQQYGTKHQNEVFTVRFRTQRRRCGESLQELAHDLDSMAHKPYPGARSDLLIVLLCGQVIGALDRPHLKIQVKQAKTTSLQEALASTMELEFTVKSSLPSFRDCSTYDFRAGRGAVSKMEEFQGTCLLCEKVGHEKNESYKRKRIKISRQGLPPPPAPLTPHKLRKYEDLCV